MSKIENPEKNDEIVYTPQLLRSQRKLYKALINDGEGEEIQSPIDIIIEELGFINGSKLIAITAYKANVSRNNSS